jgi:hypothetical protein
MGVEKRPLVTPRATPRIFSLTYRQLAHIVWLLAVTRQSRLHIATLCQWGACRPERLPVKINRRQGEQEISEIR